MTAVTASAARRSEARAALSSGEVRSALAPFLRVGAAGDRTALVELYELAAPGAATGLGQLCRTTEGLASAVLQAVEQGTLLVVPGWPHLPGYAADAGEARGGDPDARLARRVMERREHLPFEGARYVVLPAIDWPRLRKGNGHQVVPHEAARGILSQMAQHAGGPHKEALAEAARHLAPTDRSHVQRGLFLARYTPPHQGRHASPTPSGQPTTPSRLHHGGPGTTTGHLIVRVRDPLGTPISGVTVEVAGEGHHATGSDGRADFGQVPPATYTARAHRRGFGPVPAGSGVFAVGEATGSQAVTAGATATLELTMVTVTQVVVSHTPAVAATPRRIYKHAPGDAHTDHVVTCTVRCPKAAGSGAGTQIPVRVDWSFSAGGANAPKAKGGKDGTDTHFGAAPGFSMAGAGTATANTTTNDAGETRVTFRASVTSGDTFTVHAKVLLDPANAGAGELGHDDSPVFEVWKRLDYNNLYRMHTGADLGVDLASIATPAKVQPAFTPTFTELTVGPPHTVPYREYITNLVVPTAAQLPAKGSVSVHSDGADTRRVTVHGLVVAADGSTSAGTEVLTLAGTAPVAGTVDFQTITGVTVTPAAPRTVTVTTAGGAAVATLRRGAAGAAAHFLFDTAAAVQTKAKAWYDANQNQLGVDLAALNSSIGASGYFMVGAAYYHPKQDGRATTGRTSYYAGYPSIRIHYYSNAFHPDDQWGGVDGVNQGQMSCLFLNVGGGSYAAMVARHEIGHASDHVSYGPGDHCPQSTCLMYAFSQQNQFCTIGADHSVHRTEGWSR